MRYAAAVLLALTHAGGAWAQSVVEGQILTGDSLPVTAAQVELADSSRTIVLTTTTDTSGTFRIPLRSAPPGVFYLTVSSLGYASIERRPIRVGRGERVEVAVHMSPTLVALQPVNVVARRRYRPDVTEEFQDRAYWVKRTGLGHVIEYERLQTMYGWSMVAALAQAPGIRYTTISGAEAVTMRDCVPLVFLDRMPLSFTEASAIDASQLEGIEIYRGAGEVPAEYAMRAGNCGVILAWTNRRVEDGRVLTWRRAAVAGGVLVIIFLLAR